MQFLLFYELKYMGWYLCKFKEIGDSYRWAIGMKDLLIEK
jgi:hypothetical protein